MPNPHVHREGVPLAPFLGDDQNTGADGLAGYVGRIKAGNTISGVQVGRSRPAADEGPNIAEVFGALEWAENAACAGRTDLADEFAAPAVGGRPPARSYTLAREFCSTCPVIAACGSDASERLAVGLWGGSHRTVKNRDAKSYRAVPLTEQAPPHQPVTAAVPSPAVVTFPTPTTTEREAIA